MINILALITAITIAGVAAWYSIIGLMAIFSASALAIALMGGVLEVGKLVTASWLYRNWKETGFLLKSYLTSAVIILMMITSMGIFGFLSKAHLEQTISLGGNNELKIQMLERQIANEQRAITDGETVLAQLDQAVQTLIEYDRIRGEEGALAVRKQQTPERDKVNIQIQTALGKIEEINQQLLPLKKEQLDLELEVGPLKYIAEAIYGEQELKSQLDKAVRFVILVIIVVFDPLAVLLLIAANQGLTARRDDSMIEEVDDEEEMIEHYQQFVETSNDSIVVSQSNVLVVEDDEKPAAGYKQTKEQILPS